MGPLAVKYGNSINVFILEPVNGECSICSELLLSRIQIDGKGQLLKLFISVNQFVSFAKYEHDLWKRRLKIFCSKEAWLEPCKVIQILSQTK